MLLAATTRHPAMLRYLDNDQSAGRDSRAVRFAGAARRRRGEAPRITGLNENLAREVLELHTLGVTGGGAAYGGWGLHAGRRDRLRRRAHRLAHAPRDLAEGRANSRCASTDWHQPGPRPCSAAAGPEGPQALDLVLRPGTTTIDGAFRHQAGAPLTDDRRRRWSTGWPGLGNAAAATSPPSTARSSNRPNAGRRAGEAEDAGRVRRQPARLLRLGENLAARAPDAGIARSASACRLRPRPAG